MRNTPKNAVSKAKRRSPHVPLFDDMISNRSFILRLSFKSGMAFPGPSPVTGSAKPFLHSLESFHQDLCLHQRQSQ